MMSRRGLLIWIVSLLSSVHSFDPGCSFSGGQCVYDVKLGHKGQCDAATRATGGSLHGPTNSSSSHSGFQVNFAKLRPIRGNVRDCYYCLASQV